MGCGGCELFPSSGKVLAAIDHAMLQTGTTMDSRKIFKKLLDEVFRHSENPHSGHKQAVNTTNIWHLKERFAARIEQLHGKPAAEAASDAIHKEITCYAATLHLNKGANILDREGNRPGKDKPRQVKAGYAPMPLRIGSTCRSATLDGSRGLQSTVARPGSFCRVVAMEFPGGRPL
jgi:hypothetical protein